MLLRTILVALSIALNQTVFAAETSSQSEKSVAEEYRVLKKIQLGGDGSWDLLTIDSASRRLYIARSNRVMVVDIDAGKLVGEIPDLQGAHSVTVVPQLKKGFITCGKENIVRIFDLATLKVSGQAPTGKNPDASLYDPASKRVFVFDNGGTTATAIDAASGKVVGQIEIGGAPESGVTDGKGKIYVNLEDKSQIAVIDAHKLKLLANWPLAPGAEPTGLAIDLKHRRLFSGCHNNLMVVLDADTGKIIQTVPIGKGVDAAGFDPQSENAFTSNGEGTVTVVHESNPNTFAVLQNVQTQSGARTMAFDPKTHQVWVVTATPKPTPEGEKVQRGHRTFLPDSFTALVIGK